MASRMSDCDVFQLSLIDKLQMFRLLATLLLFTGLMPLSARADGPLLIELFAAKSCLASPRAYKALSRVQSSRDDVLILTWPVDYWDYLGVEPLALEESNIRQRAYADRFKLRGPYTPQAVFNGRTQCPGSRSAHVSNNIKTVVKGTPTGVKLTRDGDEINVTGPEGAEGDVFIIHFLEGEANPSHMVNPVSDVTRLLYWAGEELRIDASICHGSCAILVQEKNFGPMLATLELRR